MQQQQQLQQGFSKFAWALGALCAPACLWPLALLVSPGLSDNQNLSHFQFNLFSILLWIYPLILLCVAVVLTKLHKKNAKLARILLMIAFILFYGSLFLIFKSL